MGTCSPCPKVEPPLGVTFYSRSVCLSACRCAKISQKVLNEFGDIFIGVGRGSSNIRLDFGGDSDPRAILLQFFTPHNAF